MKRKENLSIKAKVKMMKVVQVKVNKVMTAVNVEETFKSKTSNSPQA